MGLGLKPEPADRRGKWEELLEQTGEEGMISTSAKCQRCF